MKRVDKSRAKSFGPVAPVAAPAPPAINEVSSGAVISPADVDLLALGESTEFSRYCWIAALQDLAAESRPKPAPNKAEGAPAEQPKAFEVQKQIRDKSP